jgi:hypothetical protein
MTGRADTSTTMICVHDVPRTDAAARPSAILAGDALPLEGHDEARAASDAPVGGS